MAAKKKRLETAFLRIVPLGKRVYVLTHAWRVKGEYDARTAPEPLLHGFDREDVASWPLNPEMLEAGWGNMDWSLDAGAEIERSINGYILKRVAFYDAIGAKFIIATRAKVDFSIDDQQLVDEHFGEGADISAQQFHDATGHWPSGDVDIRIETAIVPTTDATVIDDIAGINRSGWWVQHTDRNRKEAEESVTGIEDRWRTKVRLKGGDQKQALLEIAGEFEDSVFHNIDPNAGEPIGKKIQEARKAKAKLDKRDAKINERAGMKKNPEGPADDTPT